MSVSVCEPDWDDQSFWMNRERENSFEPGGLFSPDSIPFLRNWGMVHLTGWCDSERIVGPDSIRIRIGKRLIEEAFNDCEIENDEQETSKAYRLFKTIIKVGPGIKRIRVTAVDKSGVEHPLGERLIRQIDRVHTPVASDEVPRTENDYEKWLQEEEPLLRAVDRDPEIGFPVTFTWIVELREGSKQDLDRTLENLLLQSYPGMRICLIDNGKYFSGWNGKRRRKGYETHPAIRIYEKGTINEAIRDSDSEWFGFLEEGDSVESALLPDFLRFLTRNPDTRLFYTDHDYRSSDGSLSDPVVLPAWNRDLLTSYPYLGDVFLAKKEVILAVGGFGEETFHRNWSLMLQLTRACKRKEIGRLCGIYFHLVRRAEVGRSEAAESEARQLLELHLRETGEQGSVSRAPGNKGWRLKYEIPLINGEYPKVSLLIPTRDYLNILSTCIDSILEKTEYPNYEILVLDNESRDPATLAYFKSIKKKGCRIIPCPGAFNYSQINNRGSVAADGDLLGFLNNDLEVTDGSWLTEMVSQAMRRDIGAVGPKLLYPDGTLQHAGVLIGVGHVAAHAFRLFEDDPENGPTRAHLAQNYSAVTAACLIVRKKVFNEVGGFDDVNLSITNNDVDLCIKIREAGYRNLYTPFAMLLHHESASRGPEDTPEKLERYTKEVDHMWKKWPEILMDDPAYNRLLTRFKEDFSLARSRELEHYVPGRIF